MHKGYLFFLFLAIVLNAPRQSAAQRMVVSDAISIRNDYGYELIGRLRDRVLIFRDQSDNFEIQAFDAQLHLSWSRELNDIERRGVQILAVIGGKNDFSVVYKLRRRGATTLVLHKYDPGANLIDSVTIKNYGERPFNPPTLDVVRSEDRNVLAIFNTAERSQLEVCCFRIDKMQTLWDRTVYFQQDYFDSYVKSMTVGNNGNFFLVSEFNNRRAKLDDHSFRIVQVSAGPDRLYEVPLPDFLTSDLKFTVDNLNQQLVGAGLFGDKNRDRTVGSFYLRQPFTGESFVLQYNPFDEQFMSVLRRKDSEDDFKGLNDADVSHLVLRQDGGVLLVAERHHEIQRGSAAGRGFWREGMRVVVDFYFDDVFMIAMDPKGNIQWHTVLHKKQYSQDDEGIFSSYLLLRMADQLHVLFNDEIKYENSCSEYIVSAAGEFDRNSLLNTNGLALRLRYREGLQISANECIIPSEFRNRLKLVLLRF